MQAADDAELRRVRALQPVARRAALRATTPFPTNREYRASDARCLCRARSGAAEASAGDVASPLVAAALASQAAGVDAAPRRAACRLSLEATAARASGADSDSSAGFSTEGLSDSAVHPSPRSGLSPRAARHPQAVPAGGADGFADGARATASKQRQLLQQQRRRKRELEKLVAHGSEHEADAARRELPDLQAALSRCDTAPAFPGSGMVFSLHAKHLSWLSFELRADFVLMFSWHRDSLDRLQAVHRAAARPGGGRHRGARGRGRRAAERAAAVSAATAQRRGVVTNSPGAAHAGRSTPGWQCN